MMKEIGSEFWDDGPARRDKVYLLCGRTALEYIICDIVKNYKINSVLLPSYCCHTMIEPFCRHNISIRFYDVYFDETNGLSVKVPEVQENEIFYYMTYFGFNQLMGIDLQKVKKNCTVLIEDRTHSWMSENTGCGADYSYISYRKWTGFDAIALASKERGTFSEFPKAVNMEYSRMKRQASSMKRSYIDSDIGEKQSFLDLFGKAEELLEMDYVGYQPTSETMAALLKLDITYIAKIRRRNARFLVNALKDVPEIQLMFQTVNDNEVPLFVPILVRKDREELRKHLIDNSIYCPIHWPQSIYHKGFSNRAEELYEREFSLVCDQRYNLDDMERIIKHIKNYYKR